MRAASDRKSRAGVRRKRRSRRILILGSVNRLFRARFTDGDDLS